MGAVQRRESRRQTSKILEPICAGPVVRALVDLPPMRNRSAHVAQNVLPETANCTTTASKAGSAILTHRLVTQDRNSAISPSRPKLGGELPGHRTLANKKMVNRVGRHECGVTLWQIRLLPRVAKRQLDRVEVPPDGLEHNFGRRRVYWFENSIFKAPHLTVDQNRRRGVKSLEQFISASRRSSCPKDPCNWSRASTDRHDTPPGCWCGAMSAI